MSTTKKITLHFSVVAGMILLAAFSRCIPHMLNFSPLGAIALFGAAHFQKKWQAFLIPVTATWLSDLFINNVIYARYYPSFTWLDGGFYWQYISYLTIVLAGFIILKKVNVKTVLAGALASTTIFFIITNFSCWPGSHYPQTAGGLVQCYAAGVPFLKGTLLGDLFYSCVLFGGFALVQKKFPVLRLAKA